MTKLLQITVQSFHTDRFECQAGGRFGSWLAKELVKTGKHKVIAITRNDSASQLPEGVIAAKVDYNDEVSVINALKGQQILIITMSVRAAPETQCVPLPPSSEAPTLVSKPVRPL